MSDPLPVSRKMTRVVCMAHRMFSLAVEKTLKDFGGGPALTESARCVRQRIQARRWGVPGQITRLDNAPMNIFNITVYPEKAVRVMDILADAAELRMPGHGMMYAQDIEEYALGDIGEPEATGEDDAPDAGLRRDMALLTCILSRAGSGQAWANVALSLGAGVPTVSRGEGKGVRDRMGLIRIAIPAEKEIVRLLAPAHDAETLRNLLIEEGRMDRAGGGFLYQTPVQSGIEDPLLRIGRQQHAASMEQVIVALDEIKGGTTWRKRFAGDGRRTAENRWSNSQSYREIVFICPQGSAEAWAEQAIESGAGGVTTSVARCLCPAPGDDNLCAREIGIVLAEASHSGKVLEALRKTLVSNNDSGARIQVIDAPAVFNHQSGFNPQ